MESPDLVIHKVASLTPVGVDSSHPPVLFLAASCFRHFQNPWFFSTRQALFSQAGLVRSSRQRLWLYCALSGCNNFFETLWKGLRLPHSDFIVTSQHCKMSLSFCCQTDRLTWCSTIRTIAVSLYFSVWTSVNTIGFLMKQDVLGAVFVQMLTSQMDILTIWIVTTLHPGFLISKLLPQGTFAIVLMQSPTFSLDGAHLSLGLRLSSALSTFELHTLFLCPSALLSVPLHYELRWM